MRKVIAMLLSLSIVSPMVSAVGNNDPVPLQNPCLGARASNTSMQCIGLTLVDGTKERINLGSAELRSGVSAESAAKLAKLITPKRSITFSAQYQGCRKSSSWHRLSTFLSAKNKPAQQDLNNNTTAHSVILPEGSLALSLDGLRTTNRACQITKGTSVLVDALLFEGPESLESKTAVNYLVVVKITPAVDK